MMLAACNEKSNDATMSNIDQQCIGKTVKALQEKYTGTDGIDDRIARGVEQVAAFWTVADGTPEEFEAFCEENFVADPDERVRMADQLEKNFERLWGCFNKMNVDLNLPIHVEGPEPTELDELFGAYSPSAHFNDDMFDQKNSVHRGAELPFLHLGGEEYLG